MGILSLFQRKQKNTQAISRSNASLERTADNILNQRGQQIVDGLNKTTASTGTPMRYKGSDTAKDILKIFFIL